MKTHVTTNENGVIISIHGRLDGLTMAQFETEIEPYLGKGSQVLTLDLSDMTYISSGGLRVIMNAAMKLRERGRQLRAVNPQPNVYSVLMLTGFQNLLTISESM